MFEDIFSYMDGVTAKYMTDGAASVASSLHDVAYTMLMLYMVLWGWSMMRGLIQEPVMDATARILRMTFIVTFATNSAMYASEIATFLYDWPPAMVGVINGTAPTSITQLLDQIAVNGFQLADQAWQAATITNMGAYFVSIIIYALTSIVTAITAFIIISAKLGLAILLSLGPLFILTMMFESTKEYFSKWLSSVFTCGITIVLASMAAMLFFKYFDAAFNAASVDASAYGGVPSLSGIAPALIFGLISGYFLAGIPSFASGLGGGISGASSAGLGWAYDKMKSATSNAPRLANASYRGGKAAYRGGKAAYQGIRGAAGRFGKGTSGGNVKGSSSNSPVYKKITSGRRK